MAGARSCQHHCKNSPALAYLASNAYGRHGARRRIVSAQLYPHRVSALRHISSAGRLRHESKHSSGRHFLDFAAPATQSRVSRGRNGGGLFRVCIRGRGRCPCLARGFDAGDLFRSTLALSWAQYAQCNRRRGRRRSHRRARGLVRRKFPAYVPGRGHHRRNCGAAARTQHTPLCSRSAVLAGEELRLASRTKRGANAARPALDRWPTVAVPRKSHGQDFAGISRLAHDHQCRTRFRFHPHAGGTRDSDGIPLSSCNDHGNACESRGDTAHAAIDASRSNGSRAGICFAHTGKARGLDFWPCPARHHRNSSPARRSSNRWRFDRRLACGHTVNYHDADRNRCCWLWR